MKSYLLDTFQYNNVANKLVLEIILGSLPDKSESVRLFSHLIISQNNWMKRIRKNPLLEKLDWWESAFDLSELRPEWDKSFSMWIDFLELLEAGDLGHEIKFKSSGGTIYSASIRDVTLQLNYHSIHHRAQIQTIIRQQGLTPPFVDYIGTVWKKES